MRSASLFALLVLCVLGVSETIADPELLADLGVGGPPLEIVHLFNDQWPTGITVSKTGRKFSNYPPGLDPNNTHNGSNGKYTVAELTSDSTERPYPNSKINSPPGGAINFTTVPATGASYTNYLIGVQSVVLDSLDRLWILDTGRAALPNGTLVPASYGGTKLVCVSLDTDEVIQTITFPPNVAYPESYFNDVRFDLRNSITESGKGVAYITDSSPSGKNGIVVVDLGTANSWRHLDGHESVLPEDGFVPFIWGTPVYSLPKGPEGPVGFVSFGSDGIAISKDGEKLYFGAVGGRMLWEVPTKGLRSAEQESAERVKQEVKALGERSVSDGFETDSLGRIWLGAIEQNGVGYWDEGSGRVEVVVRDPRINWVDTLSVGSDGYLYFTVNQLNLLPSFYPGTDRRKGPFALFRIKLPDNATRVFLKDTQSS